MEFRMSVLATSTLSLAAGVAALALSGCGVGLHLEAPSNAAAAGISGIAHGGPNPVIGATVKLYATTSSGYGAAPMLLGTAVTGTNGGFSFVSPAACAAGQQAYVTASGGNPGSGTNPNYLLVAALGPCANVSSATSVWVDEVTTVAAAYALRAFTTVTSANVVQIGAPANNNAATGSCATTVNVTSGCTAAGLTHAFANALNLANSVSVSGVAPNGTAYQVTPSNPNGVVPAALLNSLADAVEACVNSGGGAAGDGSSCGNLFSYTTPPVTGAAAPTNTLQAMLNVAQYPALTPANVTGVFNAATPISFYGPALTSAPTDFSLAIGYSSPTTVAGVVSAITPTVNNASGFGSGTGYTAVPAVTLSGGNPTTAATATASLGLTLFNVVNNTVVCPDQAGQTNAVVISGGGGSGAAATATFNSSGVATGGTVTAAGSSYTSVPTFTITCTSGGTAVSPTISANSKEKGLGVVSFTITNPGAGYSSAPTVAVGASTGTGTGANGAPVPANAAATATVAAQSTPAPYSLALDANDDVYIGWQNAAGTSGYTSFVTGFSANGSSIFATTPSTTLTAPRGSATDTLGHLWIAENNTTTVQGFSTAGGAAYMTLTTGTAPFGLGVDKANNVWYGVASTTAQNLFELQQATTYTNAVFATPPVFANPVRAIAFDSNQNAFVSGFNATTNTAGVLPNSGTAALPLYGAAVNPVINVTLTGGSGAGLALDASNNAWAPTTTGLFEVMPANSGATVTALSATGPIADGSILPNYDAVDGAGSIWVTNNSTTAPAQTINQYVPGTGAASMYSPCYAASGAQTCAAALSQPQRTQVDSTGSVWITSLSNGRIYQLLGTGSPTWPQLSLGAQGVMPQ
jgi:hypothetical protein